MIYYLSKDWKEEDGGILEDLQTGERHVPTFNTLIAFKIPRLHQVTKVVSETKVRFSVFGWFLKEGKLYALDNEEDGKKKKKNKQSIAGGAARASSSGAGGAGQGGAAKRSKK